MIVAKCVLYLLILMEFECLRLWYLQIDGLLTATARAKSWMMMPGPPLTRVHGSVIAKVPNE